MSDGPADGIERTSEPVIVEWRGGLDNQHSVKVDPYAGEITVNGRTFAIGSLEDPDIPDWMYRSDPSEAGDE